MPANYLEINLKQHTLYPENTGEILRSVPLSETLEIRYTRDGLPVPVVEKKCLHSLYQPQAEARKWVESLNLDCDQLSLLVVGGLGFAYHLTELCRRVPASRVVVVEPDPALAAAALTYRPPDVFPEGLKIIIGQSPVQAYQLLHEQFPDIAFPRCLVHPASSQLQPDYYRTLQGIFQVQRAAQQGGYKILLVSPLYGGSLPLCDYIQRALQDLGHRCEVLDNSVFYPGLKFLDQTTSNRAHQAQLRSLLTTLLAEAVTARAVEMRADLVLGLAQAPFTREVLTELKKAGILTAFWFVEDGELFPYWRNFAALFDHYFVIQNGEFLDQLKEAGCTHRHYLPLAADPGIHRPLQMTPEEIAEFGSDLSHVGAGYYNRRQVFTTLLDYDFKLWGNDWDNPGSLSQILQREGQRLSAEDSVKVFNASRINLNLHSSTYHEAVNPFGDYLNPRTFEIGACGAFQLVDERRHLAENFVLDKEIVSFLSARELREKIDYYLAHPPERLQIAQACYHRVLREHTYQHRLLELLGTVAGTQPNWKPKAGGLPTAQEIINHVGTDSDLGQIMARFLDRRSLTLEEVAEDIERRSGKLNRTEAMILLLNEFRRWGLEKRVL